jgi:hypothetical protein
MIAAILNLGFATHHLAMALERLACALRELFLHQLGEWEKCPRVGVDGQVVRVGLTLGY